MLKGVSPQWPLRGSITIDGGSGPQQLVGGDVPRYLAAGEIWVQQDLLLQLDVKLGEEIRLGEQQFTIAAAILVEEPGGGSIMMSAAPSVIISDADLTTTGLDGFASRVNYFDQYTLPLNEDPQIYATHIREQWNLSTPRMGGFPDKCAPPQKFVYERLKNPWHRSIVSSIALGIFAFSFTVGSVTRLHWCCAFSAWFVINTLDHALLSVLGARPWRIVAIMVAQLLILGLAGGLMGALLGSVIYMSAAAIFSGLVDWNYPVCQMLHPLPGGYSLG